ncbi:hypothetical protein HB371_18385 [Acinetobacter baumannii]|uniref:hypothetical protein n=1 Tax=Acinetobacter baumannii TaxID=470 RepID=UPI001459A387|nr:hypothetical protein [Acinetobacter baumannii]NLZ23939.1 hypothetical protein [Acinetobacter baumannii]
MATPQSCNKFVLKASCKDCPFRKDSGGYLHPERVREIVNYMSKDDALFPCHKTVGTARTNLNEALELLEDELAFNGLSHDLKARKELEENYEIHKLQEAVMEEMKSEKVCAGWLILGKKEQIINNNFPLRLAQMQGLLQLNELIREDEIYDSIEQAVSDHS